MAGPAKSIWSQPAAGMLCLTVGQSEDGPEGRHLIEAMGCQDEQVYLLMDSAYEGDDTRSAALARNFIPVVPANPKRKQPWELDKPRYRQRNEVERLFRRIKAYRRVLPGTTSWTGCLRHLWPWPCFVSVCDNVSTP